MMFQEMFSSTIKLIYLEISTNVKMEWNETIISSFVGIHHFVGSKLVPNFLVKTIIIEENNLEELYCIGGIHKSSVFSPFTSPHIGLRSFMVFL